MSLGDNAHPDHEREAPHKIVMWEHVSYEHGELLPAEDYWTKSLAELRALDPCQELPL